MKFNISIQLCNNKIWIKNSFQLNYIIPEITYIMKTIPVPIYGEVTTPVGADYFTCPICYKMSDSLLENYTEDVTFYHCEKCGIIFTIGCVKIEKGCTDSTYNALVIDEFTENGQTTKAMPVFDSMENAERILPTLSVKFICLGKEKCKCKK